MQVHLAYWELMQVLVVQTELLSASPGYPLDVRLLGYNMEFLSVD